MRRAGGNLIEAFIVQFQAVPEGDFVVPAGFERLIALPNPAQPAVNRAMTTAGAAVALLLAWSAPVLAQPGLPRLRPARDVVVAYVVEGPAANLVPGGLHGPVRLSWDAAGQRVRAEAEGRSQVALIDLRAHAGQAIDTALRVSLPLPLRANDLQLLSLENARLVAGGRETIAGLPCTAYSFDSPQGPGSVCLTADGVPLRGEGTVQGKPGRFTAQTVRFGALPPGLFEVPAGYIALGGAAGAAGKLSAAGAMGLLGNLLGHAGR